MATKPTFQNLTNGTIGVPRYNESYINIPYGYYVTGDYYNSFITVDGIVSSVKIWQALRLSDKSLEIDPDLSLILYDYVVPSTEVPVADLPPIAINDTFVVSSEVEMLALTAETGDVAIRTDENKTYILSTDIPGNLADWKEILSAGIANVETPNTVFAGPTTAPAAAPVFRSLVTADLGTTLAPTFSNITDSALTSGYVVVAGAAGLLSGHVGMTASSGALTLTSQGAGVTPLTLKPHASQTAPLLSAGETAGDNVAGIPAIVQGHLGTGTGVSGTLVFQVGTPQAAGATAHVPVTVMSLGNPGTPQVLVPNGSSTVPGLAFLGDNTQGFARSTSSIKWIRLSSDLGSLRQGGVGLTSGGVYAWATSATVSTGTQDLFLSRAAAATLQLGEANSATPVGQVLQAQGARGGTDTNVAGASLTQRPGAGTGSATGSAYIVQSPQATTSGTTAQTPVERARFNSSGLTISNGELILTPTVAPGAPTLAATVAGTKPAGTWNYKCVWVTAGGETELGTVSSNITVDGTKAVTVTQPASPPANATGWQYMSSKLGPTTTWWVTSGTLPMATLTSDDNTADAALTVDATNYSATAGRGIWFGASRIGLAGTNSSAFGVLALSGVTGATNSSAFGYAALNGATGATYSSAFGVSALSGATGATSASAFGYAALNGATGATFSSAFGYAALNGATGATNSSAFGSSALYGATGATYSSAFGVNALYSATGATYSSAFGVNALSGATGATNSSAFGASALYGATGATNSSAFGYQSGQLLDIYGRFAPLKGSWAAAKVGSGALALARVYRVLFTLDGVDTALNTTVLTVVAGTASASIDHTGIPVYSGPKTCTARKLFKQKTTDKLYYFVGTIADNVTTTYSDTQADATYGTVAATPANTLALGANATTWGANEAAIGSSANPIDTIYLGGQYHLTPATAGRSVTVRAMGGNGTDKAGGDYITGPGAGTGAAVGSVFAVETPTAHGSDAVAQTQTRRLTVKEGHFNISGLQSYVSNALALIGGLVAGDLYTVTGTDPLQLAIVY